MNIFLIDDCPGEKFIEHLMNKWALLIIESLSNGPLRFYLLRNSIPNISEKMLIQNINVLLRDGILSKSIEHHKLPKVTYELTDIGYELADQYIYFKQWIGSRIIQINQAQKNYDNELLKHKEL